MSTTLTEASSGKKKRQRQRRPQLGKLASATMTPAQFEAWFRLSRAQSLAVEARQTVPCLSGELDFDHRPTSREQRDQLKLACLSCPVFDECLAYRHSDAEVYGVVAGEFIGKEK